MTNESTDPLTDEALAWLVRLHSGDETPADWAAYEDWKALTPARTRAAAEAERLWETLGPTLARGRFGKGGIVPLLLIGVLVLAGLAFAGGFIDAPRTYLAGYQTNVGQRKTVTLADGSRVELDGRTSFDVDITTDARRLRLYEGQIFVTVAGDAARPFTVETDEGTVRALGTAFDVDRRPDGTTRIFVTEHAVRARFGDDTQRQETDVRAGQHVRFTKQAGLDRPLTADVDALGAWRSGRVVFVDRPLGDVVDDLSRYRRGRILMTDEKLRKLPVTGVFDVGDSDALLDTLPTILPVAVTRFPLFTIIQNDGTDAAR